jgi:hypothetical protein
MSVSLDPLLCTETANPNYTIGSFELFATPAGGVEFSLGNIDSGDFTFTPNVLEHRKGTTNSLDAIFAIGKDYTINITADEVTARNLGFFLNEDPVTVAEGCLVPLTGSRCTITYGVRLFHEFPCEDKTFEIFIPRASVLGEFTLSFSREGFASFTGVIRALDCSSHHPTRPFGWIVISEPCPTS